MNEIALFFVFLFLSLHMKTFVALLPGGLGQQ